MLAIGPRQLIELGLVVGIAGAAVIVSGALLFLRSPSTEHSVRQRSWTLAGASIIAAGFAIQLAGQLAR
jgi:hypothetical protein